MKKLSLFLLFLVLLSLSTLAATERDCVYYFYGENCPNCEETNLLINNLQQKHPELEIHQFESYYNKENFQLLQQYFDAYEIPEENQGLPVALISNSYFIGPKAITTFLEERIKDNADPLCPSLEEEKLVGLVGDKSPKFVIETLTLGVLTSSAIKDGLTSAALVILAIFLALLLTVRSTKKVLILGILFCVGNYLMYLLFGSSTIRAPQTIQFSTYFAKILAIILIIGCLSYVKKIARIKGKLPFEIPVKYQNLGRKVYQHILSPGGMFILGVLASLLTVPLAGKNFYILADLIADPITKYSAWSLLFYYSLIFVLPLIIILSILYLAIDKTKNQEKFAKYHKYIPQIGTALILLISLLALF